MTVTLEQADEHCRRLLRHYENFTVASRLAPRHLRRDLTRVYAFCRTTDDIGDESGDAARATTLLHAWREQVVAAFNGDIPEHPVLVALAATARTHRLEAAPFLDLIDANLQDQRVTSYEDWTSLRGYCERSAAPVGRIVLRLSGVDGERNRSLSDDVCIGLQLANFAQDVSVDRAKGRTYLVQQDIATAGEVGAIRSMAQRARRLLRSGHELEASVHGRLRLQLALYRCGGEAILDAVTRSGWDTRERRPVVTPVARVAVLVRALRATIAPARVPTVGAAVTHG